jgi:hypothetical protein
MSGPAVTNPPAASRLPALRGGFPAGHHLAGVRGQPAAGAGRLRGLRPIPAGTAPDGGERSAGRRWRRGAVGVAGLPAGHRRRRLAAGDRRAIGVLLRHEDLGMGPGVERRAATASAGPDPDVTPAAAGPGHGVGAAAVSMAKPFVGWRRMVHGRWRAVVAADAADECLAMLLDFGRESGRSGESVVLPAGRSPTDAPAAASAVQEKGR